MSAFALEDDVVCRTYSAYARAMDGLWGMLQWLDRAPQDATKRAAGIGSRTSTTPRHPDRALLALRAPGLMGDGAPGSA